MSTTRVTDSDGDVATTGDDGDGPPPPPMPPLPLFHQHRGLLHLGPNGAYIHSDKPLDPGSFIAGLMLGILMLFIIQTAMRWHARREVRSHVRAAAIGPQADDAMAAAVAALARRTATLETIVTDPAQRTAREIEALR